MMKSDIRVYICGPLTPKHGYTIIGNTTQAVDVYFRLISRGILTFCPHLCGGFPDAFDHVPYNVWMEYDEYWVKEWATHVLLLPRWPTSDGANQEAAWANATGKIVISVDDIEAL